MGPAIYLSDWKSLQPMTCVALQQLGAVRHPRPPPLSIPTSLGLPCDDEYTPTPAEQFNVKLEDDDAAFLLKVADGSFVQTPKDPALFQDECGLRRQIHEEREAKRPRHQ
eukprot:TRINITY_DN4761_c0_g2_i1.p2 TRINITY_DN4761_c0_g2~~TRINITY_DN4761_c0_g2_i1.p2  ORF type:complete len:110 (-),score=18.17 TRINITY_DN4761_c0_g2_i1:283-612(-)